MISIQDKINQHLERYNVTLSAGDSITITINATQAFTATIPTNNEGQVQFSLDIEKLPTP